MNSDYGRFGTSERNARYTSSLAPSYNLYRVACTPVGNSRCNPGAEITLPCGVRVLQVALFDDILETVTLLDSPASNTGIRSARELDSLAVRRRHMGTDGSREQVAVTPRSPSLSLAYTVYVYVDSFGLLYRGSTSWSASSSLTPANRLAGTRVATHLFRLRLVLRKREARATGRGTGLFVVPLREGVVRLPGLVFRRQASCLLISKSRRLRERRREDEVYVLCGPVV